MFKVLLILFIITPFLYSNIIEVSISGTYDFSSIQDAIEYSSNSDTVLVHPGIYYENINFLGKLITVSSKFLTTGNRIYIENTVIDGSSSSCCVEIIYYEDRDAVLSGFTLTNGSGYNDFSSFGTYGGGIFIQNSSPTITNCIIENNSADYGGGIALIGSNQPYFETNPILIDLTIRHNRGLSYGGGLYLRNYTNVEFSDSERCSIYENYSASALDIGFFHSDEPVTFEVFLDTVSVNEPYPYHIFARENVDLTLDWNTYKREVISGDIYVSLSGDNLNSGTSPDSPLKNLHIANSLIMPSDDNPVTLHIDDGVFSESENGDLLPIAIKSNMTILGTGADYTILDGELNTTIILSSLFPYVENSSLSDFTVTRGRSNSRREAVYIHGPKDFVICNLNFIENRAGSEYGISALTFGSSGAEQEDSCRIVMENVLFEANLGSNVFVQRSCDLIARNVIFRNNGPNLVDFNPWETEYNGIFLGGYYDSDYPCRSIFENCLFNNNVNLADNGLATVGGIYEKMYITCLNCTFSGNYGENFDSDFTFLSDESILELINCIFTDERAVSVSATDYDEVPNTLIVRNTLFSQNEPIYISEGQIGLIDYATIIFDDPLFLGSDLFPYSLFNLSPCINAGTDIISPDIIPSDFDLAGNPRIFDDIVDIGAYEWQGTFINDDIIIPNKSLSNFPNPFNPYTTISFYLTDDTKIELSIYNIRGQKVKNLINDFYSSGYHTLVWDGCNDMGLDLTSGIYLSRLVTENQVSIDRMILLK